ncbi:MAG: zf-HC2 domain-containing protein [Acidimicrobiia bacterium]
MDVSCSAWRDAISAIADGEEPELDARLVSAHVARCPSCAAFQEDVHRLSRHAGTEQAAQMPDLAPTVVKAAQVADRLSVWWVLRLGLIIVAVQISVFAAPALLFGETTDTGEHAARHLGSFALAYAIGLVVVAMRPAKARGMLPMATALAACLAITAVIDVARGRSPIIGEVAHLPELMGLVFVWLLAAAPRRAAPTPSSAAPPRLRVVDRNADTSRRESS